MRIFIFSFALIAITFCSCTNPSNKKDRLAKSSREDKNGWVYVHLEGSPSDIGYRMVIY